MKLLGTIARFLYCGIPVPCDCTLKQENEWTVSFCVCFRSLAMLGCGSDLSLHRCKLIYNTQLTNTSLYICGKVTTPDRVLCFRSFRDFIKRMPVNDNRIPMLRLCIQSERKVRFSHIPQAVPFSRLCMHIQFVKLNPGSFQYLLSSVSFLSDWLVHQMTNSK